MAKIQTTTSIDQANIIFDLAGSLVTSKGDIPNYKRASIAYTPFVENGNIDFKDCFSHQPRISKTGNILLEKEATNLLGDVTDFTDTKWIRGSLVTVISNIGGLSNINFNADLISFASLIEQSNLNTNKIWTEVKLSRNQTYCLSAYINLRSGSFSSNSYLGVVVDNEIIAKIDLDYWFNDVYERNRYVPLYCVFKLDGTLLNDISSNRSSNEDSYVPVKIEFFCDEAVTFYCAGIQLEEGAYPTSFIVANGVNQSRARDELVYEKSPFKGLTSFTFFMHIDRWAGDGRIFEAGNIKAYIRASKLVVELNSSNYLNTEFITQEYVLPQNTDIAFRIKNGTQAKLYVDGELRAVKSLPFNFAGAAGNITFGGQNVLSFNNFYVFNKALDDGEPGLFGFAGGNLAAIFSKKYGLPVNENAGTIVFPAITVPANGRAYVNFPRSKYASQKITGKANETATTKQSISFTCIDTSTGTASITLNIGSGDVTFSYTVPANKTRAEIAQAIGDLILADSSMAAALDISYTVDGVNTTTGGFSPTEYSNAFSRPTQTPTQIATEAIRITKKNATGPAISYSHSTHFTAKVLTPHQSTTDYLVVSNPFDFRLGQAFILDGYSTICEVIINKLEVVAGEGRVYCYTNPSTFLSLISPNRHTLFQANWITEIAPINYVVDHLEGYKDISVFAKAMDGFVFSNSSSNALTITPHVSVLF